MHIKLACWRTCCFTFIKPWVYYLSSHKCTRLNRIAVYYLVSHPCINQFFTKSESCASVAIWPGLLEASCLINSPNVHAPLTLPFCVQKFHVRSVSSTTPRSVINMLLCPRICSNVSLPVPLSPMSKLLVIPDIETALLSSKLSVLKVS